MGLAERVIGVGAINLDGNGAPDTLYVDQSAADGLAELLTQALVGRAAAILAARAA